MNTHVEGTAEKHADAFHELINWLKKYPRAQDSNGGDRLKMWNDGKILKVEYKPGASEKWESVGHIGQSINPT